MAELNNIDESRKYEKPVVSGSRLPGLTSSIQTNCYMQSIMHRSFPKLPQRLQVALTSANHCWRSQKVNGTPAIRAHFTDVR